MAKRLGGIRKPKKPVLRDETYLTKLKNFWHRHRSKILLAGGLGAVAYLAKRKFANKIIANQAQHNAILSQPVSTEIQTEYVQPISTEIQTEPLQVFDQVRKFGEELEKRTAMLDTITLERDRALYDLKEEKIKRDRLSKIMDVQINDLQEEAIGLRNQRDQIQQQIIKEKAEYDSKLSRFEAELALSNLTSSQLKSKLDEQEYQHQEVVQNLSLLHERKTGELQKQASEFKSGYEQQLTNKKRLEQEYSEKIKKLGLTLNSTKSELQNVNQELGKLKKEMSSVASEKSAIENSIKNLQSQISSKDITINTLIGEKNTMKSQRDRAIENEAQRNVLLQKQKVVNQFMLYAGTRKTEKMTKLKEELIKAQEKPKKLEEEVEFLKRDLAKSDAVAEERAKYWKDVRNQDVKKLQHGFAMKMYEILPKGFVNYNERETVLKNLEGHSNKMLQFLKKDKLEISKEKTPYDYPLEIKHMFT